MRGAIEHDTLKQVRMRLPHGGRHLKGEAGGRAGKKESAEARQFDRMKNTIVNTIERDGCEKCRHICGTYRQLTENSKEFEGNAERLHSITDTGDKTKENNTREKSKSNHTHTYKRAERTVTASA